MDAAAAATAALAGKDVVEIVSSAVSTAVAFVAAPMEGRHTPLMRQKPVAQMQTFEKPCVMHSVGPREAWHGAIAHVPPVNLSHLGMHLGWRTVRKASLRLKRICTGVCT